MSSRWLRACRRLAPRSLRERVFDPAVNDLLLAAGAGPAGFRLGAAGRIRLAVRVLFAALQCQWLAVAGRRPSGREPGREAVLFGLDDLARAFRVLRREPVFATVAILTLALGLAVNIATFGFANTLLLSPLPVPEPGRLVRVFNKTATHEFDTISYPDYADARRSLHAIDLAAHTVTEAKIGSGVFRDTRTVELVTGNFFNVMGLRPLAGRLLDASDDAAGEGAAPVVVLAEDYCRTTFGEPAAAVGRTLVVNSAVLEIVGVVPAPFRGTYSDRRVDFWAPVMMQRQVRPRGMSLNVRGWGWLSMVGRLQPGATIDRAATDLNQAAARINEQVSRPLTPIVLTVRPASAVAESERKALGLYFWMAAALSGLLLFVTCANLAGLMQARLVARGRELAIRQSLGASRGRLVWEWLAECLALSVMGGLVGLALAWGLAAMLARLPIPGVVAGSLTISASFDWRVATFSLGLSLATGVVFGLVTALRAGGRQPLALLKEDGATSMGGRHGARLRRLAVVAQGAASAMLLVVCGLLVFSLRARNDFDPGFSSSHLALAALNMRRDSIGTDEWGGESGRLLDRLRAVPGVSRVDLATELPLDPGHDAAGFRIPGHEPPPGRTTFSLDYNVVTAGYFETMGIPFVAGGPWNARAVMSTTTAAPPVVVINDTMARRFWPKGDALGSSIELVGRGRITIVGVVRDIAYHEVGEPRQPYVYLPAEAVPQGVFTLHLRTAGQPAAILADVARAIAGVDTRLTIDSLTTFEDVHAALLFPAKALAVTAAAFGAIALLLTGIGLYGVVSTSVGRRTREIGLRMALGAQKRQVLGGVMGEAVLLTIVASAIGLVSSYFLSDGLRAFLFRVAPFDVRVYAIAAGLLAVLAIAAAWAPARRAASVDPVVALRS